jgi:hypothetical protein
MSMAKLQIGIEGMFVIVQNNTETLTPPITYFTDDRLEHYMLFAVGRKWESVDKVSSKMEAFAVANMDVSRTPLVFIPDNFIKTADLI